MQNIENSDLWLQRTDKKIEMIKELIEQEDIALNFKDAKLPRQRPSRRRFDQQ